MSRRKLPAYVAAGFFGLAPAGHALAQDMAALVADQVVIDGTGQLVADGGVEIFYQGRTLRAQQIIFNQEADTLKIVGPITLIDADGAIVLADQADLSADMTEGVMQSARIVLNRELQLASPRITRREGRYTELANTVASSCKVCADSQPLWEIRAKRVLHDAEEKQIYFEGAQFRVAGVPLAYIPQLRLPDPTLDRADGILTPSILSSSGLGFGIKVPYFKTLGPHRDILFTPFVSTKGGKQLELRYRQAFTNGDITLLGAVAGDKILPGQTRGYANAFGSFNLPEGFGLSFNALAISDPGYMLDYGLPDTDRPESRVEVSRTRRDEYISARYTYIHSLRDTEVNSRLPSSIGDLTFNRRFSGGPLGGEAGLKFQSHAAYRSSDDPFDPDGPAGPANAYGRDLWRNSLTLDWQRNWILDNGMIVTSKGEITGDAYSIKQDDSFEGQHMRLHGGLATELRWPLLKSDAGGVGHIIEPIAQFVWAPSLSKSVPNEDSLLVEFDEGNLFSLNRFPGADAVEHDPRVNLGVSYTRFDPAGWSMSTTLGRVIRAEAPNQFSKASGLDGRSSDWLGAVRLSLPNGLTTTQRVVFDSEFEVTKAESRVDYVRSGFGIGGSYTWVMADPVEERWTDLRELAINGNYDVTSNWSLAFESRIDIDSSRTNRAGLGVSYRNECVSVDLSVSRRYASSTSVKPSTDFGLTIDLIGFGTGGVAGPAAMCRS